ncbi:helix-turn-helix domain-containing protein [Streptomyces avidinii]|uniref:helix-turn-helix domain-containing protein n=1 Tax=Streptomyces avidinii TaxID=1895 RepID=UPI00379029E9
MRLTRRYVVIANHLSQHDRLSATAIGISVYLQSLPEGAPVSVKALAARFPEGEIRIAAALRELEKHGFLERRRERLATGQVVTRTYSYNVPGAAPGGPPEPPGPPDRAPVPEPVVAPEPVPQPQEVPAAEPEPAAAPAVAPAQEAVPDPVPGAAPAQEAVPDPVPVPAPVPDIPAPPGEQRLHPGAVDLLAGLRRRDPRLLLGERDVRRLAPGASAWLERGIAPEMVARALCAGLPEQMRRPASVLAYRLAELIPPHLPPAPPGPEARDMRPPDPLQNCGGCDRAFRAPKPGRCRDCPPAEGEAAAA